MIEILHDLKDPKLWEIMVYSFLWVMQGLYHQPYLFLCFSKKYLCDFHAHTFYNVALQHAVLLLQTEVLEFWGFNSRAPTVGFL